MGEVLVGKLRELQDLPEDEHLFCPRRPDDSDGYYYDEDVYFFLDSETEEARKDRLAKIEQAKAKKNLVLDCLPIFAFNGPDAAPYQTWLKDRLKHNLSACDVCIRIYHNSRGELKHKLEEEYDSEEVESFMETFDSINVERITAELDRAAERLRSTPQEKRGIGVLDQDGQLALFESLSCDAMLKNETLMRDHFDEPFALVQTKKRLRLGVYTTAMTRFLFSTSNERFVWASVSWKNFKRPPTKQEFAAVVHAPLFDALKRVQLSCLDKDFLPSFWQGARIIVNKLDKDLITHSLRAIDIDICKLTLEHFQFNFSGFNDLISTVQLILEKSPVDFWDAMGAISPVTVIEQILNNPTLEQILLRAGKQDASGSHPLDEIFGWVKPFFASIKPSNQTPACRSLVHQLLTRFQLDKYSNASRTYCYELGLRVLLQALQRLNEGNTRSTFVGHATVLDMMDFIKMHMEDILATIRVSASLQKPQLVKLGTGVIQYTLSLDCLSLDVDREILFRDEQLHHVLDPEISSIWDQVVKAINPGDIDLSTAALMGASQLVGMEIFFTKAGTPVSKGKNWWNNAFYSISRAVTNILERVSEFNPEDLDKLFDDGDTARSVIVHLFSSEAEPRQASIEILKVVSCKSDRRDALSHLITAFFHNSLKAIESSLRRISTRNVFAPMPSSLKLCTDLIDTLCSPEDGFLRTKDLDAPQKEAAERVWFAMWTVLITIFKNTENWSFRGYEKEKMMNFCRDTMDFVDVLYEQYLHFAAALNQGQDRNGQSAQNNLRKLLKLPQITMDHMIQFLRLRDEYLITKAVALTCKMLGQLRDVEIDITRNAKLFIMEIIEGAIRTKLSPQQQAQLERALEAHTGESLKREDKISSKAKQGTLASWAKSGPSKSATPGSSEAEDSESALKRQLSENTQAAQAWKAAQDARHRQTSFPPKKKAQPAPQPMKPDRSEFMRQRELEKEALRKANAEAVRRVKKNIPLLGSEGGTGTKGIGVVGKDHSIKGDGVMVSSSESEDSDDDEIDAELFGPSVKVPKPKAKLPLIAQGPVKKKRVVRSFKDMRARLAPDLSSLHKTILSWDYFHDGDFPPKSRPDIYNKVPNKFVSPVDYQNTFLPLLTLEAWQGFVKAREEGSFKPYNVKVVNRGNVDAFIELSTNLDHATNRDLNIMEGDICLLSKAPQPATGRDAPHCLARVFRITRKKAHLEVLYRIMHGPLIQHLVPNATVYGVKIQSITPLEREYGALNGLQYYDLCDEIIKAKPSPLLKYNEKQLDPLVANYNLNLAQAKAVKSAVDNDAFTLIQGPPGSGKTKTIVAIVGALLTDSLKSVNATVINKPMPSGINPMQARNSQPAPKKLLVCAPSNAAVDELVMRFKEGVKTTGGQSKKISVVRLGRSDAMNANVKDVTLDELVNKSLNVNPAQKNDAREETSKLMSEHQKISEKLREARQKLDSGEIKGQAGVELKEEFDALRRAKTQLGTRIDSAKDNESNMSRQNELDRKRAQQKVLDDAHVICATLSGSGHEMFQNLNIEFETVVVDEAAQCVEMSALIPLKYGCQKAILVGDPKQLPPTVFSKEAARFQYEQSLFVRMQMNHPDYVHLLDTQYRMHPEISWFPSQTFYDGRLLDGPDMAGLRVRPWHRSALLAPYRFFDVQGQHQAAPKGHSLINVAEIEVAMHLYSRLMADYQNGYDFKGKIGVITPYKSQLRELKDRFLRKYGQGVFENVEFNTTDAYQGRESEVIIFSCVRASPAGGIGFLQDIRRMNVGLTRAKSSLWVLGNSQSLVRGEFWRKLVEDAQKRDRYTQGDLMGMLRQHSTAFPAPKEGYAGPAAGASNGDTIMKEEPIVKQEIKPEPADTKPAIKTEPSKPTNNLAPKSKSAAIDDDPWADYFGDGAKQESESDDEDDEDADGDIKMEDRSNSNVNSAPGSSRPASASASASRPGTPAAPTAATAHTSNGAAAATAGQGAAGSAARGGAPPAAAAPSGPSKPRMVPAKRKKADPFMPSARKKR
ncbi:SEN1 N terminal-domain-containing protein [Phyllosticta citribraziliensis]|uniref:SEN1 N terminal-domain-containing protein n=1 Tax=Phyllosticta citribraziliensis TaxID=989973 RepID=A0ABR1LMP5_9PEZI